MSHFNVRSARGREVIGKDAFSHRSGLNRVIRGPYSPPARRAKKPETKNPASNESSAKNPTITHAPVRGERL